MRDHDGRTKLQFDPAGFVQARAGSRAAADNPSFRYVAETRLSGREPFSEPERLNVPAVDAAWYRATFPDVGGREPNLHFAGVDWRELRDPGPRRLTLAALLRVCGLRSARTLVEDTGWLRAIGAGPPERSAFGQFLAGVARVFAPLSDTAARITEMGCYSTDDPTLDRRNERPCRSQRPAAIGKTTKCSVSSIRIRSIRSCSRRPGLKPTRTR